MTQMSEHALHAWLDSEFAGKDPNYVVSADTNPALIMAFVAVARADTSTSTPSFNSDPSDPQST